MTASAAASASGGRHGWKGTWWPWLAMVVVLAAVLVIGALGDRGPATQAEQVNAVAGTIRCPTCQGESVQQSDADISKQIRIDIAQRLQRGETPDQIRSFYASRYGQGILLTPTSTGVAGLVWILPVALAVLAVAGLIVVFRRWQAREPAHASAADRALVASALGAHDQGAGALDPGDRRAGDTADDDTPHDGAADDTGGDPAPGRPVDVTGPEAGP